MARYLPYENFTYVTDLSGHEVFERLGSVTAPGRNLSTGLSSQLSYGENKGYRGEISGNRFRILRAIYYRNSFLPVIEGTVTEDGGKTYIHVKMQLHLFPKVFLIAWLSIVGITAIAVAAVNIIEGFADFHPAMLTPYGLFGLGCLLAILPFRLEANRSKHYFAGLFEAETMEN